MYINIIRQQIQWLILVCQYSRITNFITFIYVTIPIAGNHLMVNFIIAVVYKI